MSATAALPRWLAGGRLEWTAEPGPLPRPYLVTIAAFTFASSSGVTSLTPCSCFACSATFCSNSSSVAASAVNLQPGTTFVHAIAFAILPPRNAVYLLGCRFEWRCDIDLREHPAVDSMRGLQPRSTAEMPPPMRPRNEPAGSASSRLATASGDLANDADAVDWRRNRRA